MRANALASLCLRRRRRDYAANHRPSIFYSLWDVTPTATTTFHDPGFTVTQGQRQERFLPPVSASRLYPVRWLLTSIRQKPVVGGTVGGNTPPLPESWALPTKPRGGVHVGPTDHD